MPGWSALQRLRCTPAAAFGKALRAAAQAPVAPVAHAAPAAPPSPIALAPISVLAVPTTPPGSAADSDKSKRSGGGRPKGSKDKIKRKTGGGRPKGAKDKMPRVRKTPTKDGEPGTPDDTGDAAITVVASEVADASAEPLEGGSSLTATAVVAAEDTVGVATAEEVMIDVVTRA